MDRVSKKKHPRAHTGFSKNQVPACQGRAAQCDGCSDPIGPPGRGYSQSESSLASEDVPVEIQRAPGISHICTHLVGWENKKITRDPTPVFHS